MEGCAGEADKYDTPGKHLTDYIHIIPSTTLFIIKYYSDKYFVHQ